MKNMILLSVIIALPMMQDFDELYFGENDSFEIMTWNIEWFPKNGNVTVDYVTQIIEALDVDLIAMQELSDTLKFNQMIEDLVGYEGYYQSSWFAGLAYIYKTDVIEINDMLFLDGTFYDKNEISHRDISIIPHPSITDSLEKFSSLNKTDRKKIFFTHLNHTNTIIQDKHLSNSSLISNGYNIAQDGKIFYI